VSKEADCGENSKRVAIAPSSNSTPKHKHARTAIFKRIGHKQAGPATIRQWAIECKQVPRKRTQNESKQQRNTHTPTLAGNSSV